MTALVFVDSNVLVYARDPRDAAKQSRAAYWISHLWSERLGRASAQVLSEYYVTVTRKLRPRVTSEDAWDDVKSFLAWRPQAIDDALLQRAREIEQQLCAMAKQFGTPCAAPSADRPKISDMNDS